MRYVRERAVAGAAAVMVLSSLGGAAGAGAQATNPFHCEASAVRLTIGGQQAIEPATAGRTAACDNHQALPALAQSGLEAGALIARTAYDSPAGKGTATGAVAHLSINPTGSPLDGLPAGSLPALPALPTQQAAASLPPASIGLPQALADAVAPLGIPSSISVDLSKAAAGRLPAPAGGLITADLLRSDATVTCAGGAPKLDGASVLTGLKLAGTDVPLDGPLTQAVTVIGAQTLNPATFDPSQVAILTPLTGATPEQVKAIQAAVAAGLKQLPPLSVPASVAEVKIVPKEQVRTADALTQRALHATITIGGQQVLDAVVGEAAVSAATADGACAQVAAQSVSDAALGCTDRKLVLVDVLRRNGRVKLIGAANRNYVGRRVAIRLRRGNKVVAHAVVKKDGSFTTTAPMPPQAVMASHTRSNTLRYRAEIGKELSLPLKLQRRLTVSSLSSKNGKVTITGRVTGPLTTPVSTIRVVRRVSCHKVVLVKRFKPRGDGTFRVTVKAPKNQAAAVYRLATYVREKAGNPRKYPTFTLPRGVALNTR
jgi:hypothetical protein